MLEIKKLPLDRDTLKLLNYDPMYFLPTEPLYSDIALKVARSMLKFYQNQLNLVTLENKIIIIDSIKKLEIMIGDNV